MSLKTFNILQLNTGRKREVYWSLFNSGDMVDADVLFITEPYIFRNPVDNTPAVSGHRDWTILLPNAINTQARWDHAFRSFLAFHNRLNTFSQVHVDSSDITAAILKLDSLSILLISSYVPNSVNRRESQEQLHTHLNELSQVIQQAKADSTVPLEILIAGDFNRHDPLWGGTRVASSQQGLGSADDLLTFLLRWGLESMIPAGTITFENLGGVGESTVDLCLCTAPLSDRLIRSGIFTSDHGSDHKPILTELQLDVPYYRPKNTRLNFSKADWDIIRGLVQGSLQDPTPCPDAATLEQQAGYFSNEIQSILKRSIPISRPFPSAKRWWTRELTILRNNMTYWRNQWTAEKRRGNPGLQPFQEFKQAQKQYFTCMKSQKHAHWKEFISNPSNIWKAHSINKDRSGFSNIPALLVDGTLEPSEEVKAKVLLQSFYPEQPSPTVHPNESDATLNTPRRDIPLTQQEVRSAIFAGKSLSAPGTDGLPFLVWKELWPTVGTWITHLYQASLALGYVPVLWKNALILPLRKPNKDDYRLAKNFRPISLLWTISKGLERVIARRLTFYIEKYSLVPQNQFGCRPRRNTEQALNILIEAIFQAWKKGLTLSLITFDVKGAFNGVNKEALIRIMENMRFPANLVNWTMDFCVNRSASVAVGHYTSEQELLQHPGIPQGSPCSPVLYIIFNAALADQVITKKEGAICFADDFSAWVVGKTIQENNHRIQEEVIPRAVEWAATTGATFELSKTEFIHFTRHRSRLAESEIHEPIHVLQTTVEPAPYIKLLGVILDRGLRMNEHITRTISKSTRACLAIGRLQGLSPKQTKQLYNSTVVSITDYAASTWYTYNMKSRTKLLHQLERVQRLGAQAILKSFKSVPLEILQAEANLLPTNFRIQLRVAKHWINLHTLPKSHLFWQFRGIRGGYQGRFCSPFKHMATVCEEELEGRDVPCGFHRYIETIAPCPIPPWAKALNVVIESDRTLATAYAQRERDTYNYWTDGSGRNGITGSAFASGSGFTPQHLFNRVEQAITYMPSVYSNIYASELYGIYRAVWDIQCRPDLGSSRWKTFTIYTDNQSALKSLYKIAYQSGQILLIAIRQSILNITKRGHEVQFRWIPAHSGIPGNERANLLARQTTEPGAKPLKLGQDVAKVLKSALFREARKRIISEANALFDKGSKGKYTRDLDKALPRPHAARVYFQLSAQETKILIQLRTSHGHFNQYLAQRRLIPSKACGCGYHTEDVKHFILHCPQWSNERAILKRNVPDRWGDIAYMLGGWSDWVDRGTGKGKDGPRDKWKPNIGVIKNVVQFAITTGRLASYQADSTPTSTAT